MEPIDVCPFFFNIGACRLGYLSSYGNTRPIISPTLLLRNMYQRPDMITPDVDVHGNPIDPSKMQQQHFDDFYVDLFKELSKYGELMSLNICENLANHLAGNVYVRFRDMGQAYIALRSLEGTLYAGRPIIVDFSTVADFGEAVCGMYEDNDDNDCYRGGDCNFLHIKRISSEREEQEYASN